MHIGFLKESNLKYWQDLTRLAPVKVNAHPFLFLTPPGSAPTESVPDTLIMVPMAFRHIYSTVDGITRFTAGMVPGFGQSNKEMYASFGLSYVSEFVPYMTLITDGMVSLATRGFCRAISDALAGQPLEFDMTVPKGADYDYLASAFNPDVAAEMAVVNSLQFSAKF